MMYLQFYVALQKIPNRVLFSLEEDFFFCHTDYDEIEIGLS